MKLKKIVQESVPKKRNRIKLMITESQFRKLASSVIELEEKREINKTFLKKKTLNENK
jgi:hypothetical protein